MVNSYIWFEMTDVHSKEVRSYNMSRIRSKDTKPELIVRRFLFSRGFRYRLHVKDLPGKPDIDLPKYRTVIFINGCFWHGHNRCKYFVMPMSRTKWWKQKIEHNKELDEAAFSNLKRLGWKFVFVWESSSTQSRQINPKKTIKLKIKSKTIP